MYLSNYRASYRLFLIPWYKFAIPCLHLDWRLKIPQKLLPQIFNPPGGLTIRRKKSCGIFILKGKRLPSVYPFHLSIWIQDSRKNNLQSKEGYRGYRQQEALRSLQTDYKAKPHQFWHLLMQIAWPVSFSNFHCAADGHILLNAPDLFRPLKSTSEVKQERARIVLT